MQTIFTILIFILGAAIGSFLSVLNYRIEKQQPGIIFGRSKCPKCKKNLAWWQLLPLVSFIFLRGKCFMCKKPITCKYFFLELMTGLVLAVLFLKYPFISGTTVMLFDLRVLGEFIFHGLIVTILIAVFFYDLETKEIPDIFLIVLGVITVIGSLLFSGLNIISIILALIISLVFFGGQILVSKGQWLGEGDFYLSLIFAVLLGWEQFILFIVATYFIGAAISIPLLITKTAKMKSSVPFAPFMICGYLVTIFFGNNLIEWYFHLTVI